MKNVHKIPGTMDRFVAWNLMADEYDDKALYAFSKQLKSRYSENAIWMIYSCLNSKFIEEYRVNLKGFLGYITTCKMKHSYT